MIGKTISHYRIIDKLGQGGMGAVYLAHDTILDRNIALKFLPGEFSDDEVMLARLEREAKLLASSSHPNIATIHGLERAAGKAFIVMELVRGETLASRIERGRLSLTEALSICSQIAAGLESAHERGIVHRDIKPENIMITEGELIKILDFGLAKTHHDKPAVGNISQATTVSIDITAPGTVLGTAPFMSPEQLAGKAVGARTDIWSFGCVFYECLTGKRAFTGNSMVELAAVILEKEPDWTALSAEVPAAIRTLLRRCLQKDPTRRLRDIGDARLEIDECLAHPAEPSHTTRRISILRVFALALVMTAAGLGLWRAPWRTPHLALPVPMIISTIKIAPGHVLEGMRRSQEMERPSVTAIALAGDGCFIVYCAAKFEDTDDSARSQLFLRRMHQAEAVPIAGTEGGMNPFLSPDDQWVGFWADGKLMKVPLGGGVATILCEVPRILGADWGADGTIVYSQASGLFKVQSGGGDPVTLTIPDPDRNEFRHLLPVYLPDCQHVLFTVMTHAYDRSPRLALLDLATNTWRDLLPDAADARFVPTGHLVFLRRGTLQAVRFDPIRLDIIGQPVAIVDDVAQAFSQHSVYNTAAGQFDISRNGCLVYAAGGVVPDPLHSLVWVDHAGNEQPVTNVRKPFFAPRLSPDGRRIAYATRGSESRIWVYDMATDTHRMLTRGGADVWPIWSHDGSHIFFSRAESHGTAVYWKPYDGRTAMRRLTDAEHGQFASSCAADGTVLALVEVLPGRHAYDVGIVDVASAQVTPFLRTPFKNICPEFSPDGKMIAWVSDESGRCEVFVQPYPDPVWKRQLSREGGSEPLWARDGKQIFYRWQDQYWSVDIEMNDALSTTRPHLLFEKSYQIGEPIRGWDISLDAQRFLMVKSEVLPPHPLTDLTLVQNWTVDLVRRLP